MSNFGKKMQDLHTHIEPFIDIMFYTFFATIMFMMGDYSVRSYFDYELLSTERMMALSMFVYMLLCFTQSVFYLYKKYSKKEG